MGNRVVAVVLLVLTAGVTGCSSTSKRSVAYYTPPVPAPVSGLLVSPEAVALAERKACRRQKMRQMREDVAWRSLELGIDIGFKVGAMFVMQAMDNDGHLAPHEQAESLAVSAGMSFASEQLKGSLAKFRE